MTKVMKTYDMKIAFWNRLRKRVPTSVAERDLILEKMKLVSTRNMEAYLRKIAIDGYIIQVDHTDIKAMTA